MAETVQERVIRVFAEFKKVPTDEITMDTTFEELGFDSLDGLNLIFELEEEFDLTVPDDKVADMKGVRQAVEGIEMLLEAKAQGIDVNAVAAQEFEAKQAEFKAKKEADAKTETKPAEDAKPAKTVAAAETKPKKAKPAAKAKKADDAPKEAKAKPKETKPKATKKKPSA
ncbi:MAG: phosphopantetheine-binding protein [Pyrinomonadaceae bacterium]